MSEAVPTSSRTFLCHPFPFIINRADFSYQAACQFLERNNLLSIIRAHEAQDAGFASLCPVSQRR